MPTHIGTPAGQPGMPMPPQPGQPGGPPGMSPPVPGAHINLPQASAQAQGMRTAPAAAAGGPQLANSVSNTPGPGAKISPGPG
jgi:hypothetical protein